MQVLRVMELTKYIKTIFDADGLLANIGVKGEISNFKAASSGHYYFTLKDEVSAIKVVMFRSRSRSVTFRPENGMSVLVRGYISIYERDGVYQLYAEEMLPDGVGALHLAFEQLKERLLQEGLFEQKNKKKLPLLPRRIGIVTSPTGAAVCDMVEIIRRRWSGLEIILVPVPVQGVEAPPAIARGIRLLNKLGGVELIIVGRGGGSIEDLWAFNTEIVARSIYSSAIPIISAVGHETDFTIADFVADVRAATPSAAAETAVPDKRETVRYVQSIVDRLKRAAEQKVHKDRQRLDYCLAVRALARPVETFCGARQQSVDFLTHRLRQSMHKTIESERNHLAALAARLNTLSPLATLARGYSICSAPDDGRVISDVSEVDVGDQLLVRLHKGVLQCAVENMKE